MTTSLPVTILRDPFVHATVYEATIDQYPEPTDDEIRAALEKVTGIPQWAIIVTGTYDMQEYLHWIGECIMVDFEVRKCDMRLYELEGIRVDLRKYGVKWINGNACCSIELKELMREGGI